MAHDALAALRRVVAFVEHIGVSLDFLDHSLVLRREHLRLIHSKLARGRRVPELFIVLSTGLSILRLSQDNLLLVLVQLLHTILTRRACDSLSVGSDRLRPSLLQVASLGPVPNFVHQGLSLAVELRRVLVQAGSLVDYLVLIHGP